MFKLGPAQCARARNMRTQQGFLLESLGLVLLILSMLALLDMKRKFEEELDIEAVARGKALTTIRNIANDYLVTYSSELLALADMDSPMDVESAGKVSVRIDRGGYPRIDELVRLGKAPPNLAQRAPGGGNYAIRIRRVPDTCDAPQCDLEGLVSIDRPYLLNGAVDYARLGMAVAVIGNDGALSRRSSPTVLSGYAGTWSTDNPFVTGLGQVSGILAARFGYTSSGLSIFYKRDGSTPLTGDMKADGHALMDISTLTANGKITGKNLLTAVNQAGQSCEAEDENALGSSDKGAVMVCRGGQWRYAINNPVSPGAACNQEGITGTSTTQGDALVCRAGNFVHLNNLIAKNILVERVLVNDNSVVPLSSCDVGGVPDSSLIVSSAVINVATIPPMQAMDASVTRNGAFWLVSLKLVDTDRGRHSGNEFGLNAVLNLECRYG